MLRHQARKRGHLQIRLHRHVLCVSVLTCCCPFRKATRPRVSRNRLPLESAYEPQGHAEQVSKAQLTTTKEQGTLLKYTNVT